MRGSQLPRSSLPQTHGGQRLYRRPSPRHPSPPASTTSPVGAPPITRGISPAGNFSPLRAAHPGDGSGEVVAGSGAAAATSRGRAPPPRLARSSPVPDSTGVAGSGAAAAPRRALLHDRRAPPDARLGEGSVGSGVDDLPHVSSSPRSAVLDRHSSFFSQAGVDLAGGARIHPPAHRSGRQRADPARFLFFFMNW